METFGIECMFFKLFFLSSASICRIFFKKFLFLNCIYLYCYALCEKN